jgi:hypothetical protein
MVESQIFAGRIHTAPPDFGLIPLWLKLVLGMAPKHLVNRQGVQLGLKNFIDQ